MSLSHFLLPQPSHPHLMTSANSVKYQITKRFNNKSIT
jgi:hypothetical protein